MTKATSPSAWMGPVFTSQPCSLCASGLRSEVLAIPARAHTQHLAHHLHRPVLTKSLDEGVLRSDSFA